MNVKHSAKTSEWYTPTDIIKRARRVLGSFDLDPASTPDANKRVGAVNYFTEALDGLTCEWPSGTVFLNPPSRKSGKFWAKLMEHRARLRLHDAIYVAYSLEHLATCQTPLAMAHFPLVIVRKRIAFLRSDGTTGDSPGHANAIVYVPGVFDRRLAFADAFGDLGALVNMSQPPGALE